jgi:hypothetical protein
MRWPLDHVPVFDYYSPLGNFPLFLVTVSTQLLPTLFFVDWYLETAYLRREKEFAERGPCVFVPRDGILSQFRHRLVNSRCMRGKGRTHEARNGQEDVLSSKTTTTITTRAGETRMGRTTRRTGTSKRLSRASNKTQAKRERKIEKVKGGERRRMGTYIKQVPFYPIDSVQDGPP